MTDSTIQNLKFKIQNSTDYHCHLLPGLDDGPASMDEAVEMAKALRGAGFTRVHCTPHLIRGCYEADNRTVRRGIVELQSRLDVLGIDITLFSGREYYLDEFLPGYLADPLPLGDSRYLLIEIPDRTPPELITDTFTQVIRSGFTPLVAHPERSRLLELAAPPKGKLREWFKVQGSRFKVSNSKFEIQNSKLADASLLERLREMGCKFQGNLGSFAGFYGERVRRNAVRLRESGIYSHLGTDLHAVANIDMLAKIDLNNIIGSTHNRL